MRKAFANAPTWLRAVGIAALIVIALDAFSTQLAAHLGVGTEGNPLVIALRNRVGIIGSEVVFDVARLLFFGSLFAVAALATPRATRVASAAVLVGFVVLAAPVLVGNFRLLAAS